MPNKTIYVKDADLPLLEQAQQRLGDSVSSLFAEFLRERIEKLTPEESRILELRERIARGRDIAASEEALRFLGSFYDEAEAYATKSLRFLRSGAIAAAKGAFWSANKCYGLAEHDAVEVRELHKEVGGLLRSASRGNKGV